MLKIIYKNKKIECVCTARDKAERQYGSQMTKKIFQRISEIKSAESVEQMVQYGIGRCHPLSNNRKSEYAVDLVHPYRLIFEKKEDVIQIVLIKEIVDYH